MKRLFDIFFSAFGLVVLGPILLIFMFLVRRQDGNSPLYIAPRVGRHGRLFRMIKLRSMITNADKTGVDSTSSSDSRITPVGHMIRRYKLDEFMQLWNVLIGDMSLVGPRPNVQRETDLYTNEEKKLLTLRPGITDFSSIVFFDEGDILEGREDPDLSYNQLIRPWKSRLGIIYIDNHSIWLDLQLVFYTVVAIFSKDVALSWVIGKLQYLGVDEKVIEVSRRDNMLEPFPPPGADDIVTMRSV